MRVPIRKPGKYTHLKPDFNISQDKFRALKNRLEKLIKTDRPPAIAEVKFLAADGDFSENAAYQIAKGKLRSINNQITKIEERLRNANIIAAPTDSSRVGLGHLVTIEKDGKSLSYQILGSTESSPSKGIISNSSPLGQALIGKKVGDIIEIKTANKTSQYKIINIK